MIRTVCTPKPRLEPCPPRQGQPITEEQLAVLMEARARAEGHRRQLPPSVELQSALRAPRVKQRNAKVLSAMGPAEIGIVGIMAASGFNRRTVEEALRDLMRDGQVVKRFVGHGSAYLRSEDLA